VENILRVQHPIGHTWRIFSEFGILLVRYGAQLVEAGEAGKALFRVQGLICTACPPRIVKALGATRGVLNVTVDPLLERVVVFYRPHDTGPRTLIKQLESLGYTAELWQVINHDQATGVSRLHCGALAGN
jgi:copper chaperone CopZ